MDLVQDIMIGTMGGLAVRGLKRLIFGRKVDPEAQKLSELRVELREQSKTIAELQKAVQAKKRSADEAFGDSDDDASESDDPEREEVGFQIGNPIVSDVNLGDPDSSQPSTSESQSDESVSDDSSSRDSSSDDDRSLSDSSESSRDSSHRSETEDEDSGLESETPSELPSGNNETSKGLSVDEELSNQDPSVRSLGECDSPATSIPPKIGAPDGLSTLVSPRQTHPFLFSDPPATQEQGQLGVDPLPDSIEIDGWPHPLVGWPTTAREAERHSIFTNSERSPSINSRDSHHSARSSSHERERRIYRSASRSPMRFVPGQFDRTRSRSYSRGRSITPPPRERSTTPTSRRSTPRSRSISRGNLPPNDGLSFWDGVQPWSRPYSKSRSRSPQTESMSRSPETEFMNRQRAFQKRKRRPRQKLPPPESLPPSPDWSNPRPSESPSVLPSRPPSLPSPGPPPSGLPPLYEFFEEDSWPYTPLATLTRHSAFDPPSPGRATYFGRPWPSPAYRASAGRSPSPNFHERDPVPNDWLTPPLNSSKPDSARKPSTTPSTSEAGDVNTPSANTRPSSRSPTVVSLAKVIAQRVNQADSQSHGGCLDTEAGNLRLSADISTSPNKSEEASEAEEDDEVPSKEQGDVHRSDQEILRELYHSGKAQCTADRAGVDAHQAQLAAQRLADAFYESSHPVTRHASPRPALTTPGSSTSRDLSQPPSPSVSHHQTSQLSGPHSAQTPESQPEKARRGRPDWSQSPEVSLQKASTAQDSLTSPSQEPVDSAEPENGVPDNEEEGIKISPSGYGGCSQTVSACLPELPGDNEDAEEEESPRTHAVRTGLNQMAENATNFLSGLSSRCARDIYSDFANKADDVMCRIRQGLNRRLPVKKVLDVHHQRRWKKFQRYSPQLTATPNPQQRDDISRAVGSEVGDLLASPRVEPEKRCRQCLTTTTPVWRKDSEGNKTLCNVCGVRLMQKEGKWQPTKKFECGGEQSLDEDKNEETERQPCPRRGARRVLVARRHLFDRALGMGFQGGNSANAGGYDEGDVVDLTRSDSDDQVEILPTRSGT